ncbi:MAG: NapC/NirT family cytochrome c [Anaerolineales bacterium]
MKKLLQKIKHFFIPPPGSPTWRWVLPYASLGVLTVLFLTAAAFTWEYTNSPQFCGTSCHTMPPEYTAYLTSPHARIDCVDCHIGKGFITTKITRKAGDAKHIVSLVFKNYEYPIRAHDLRPARETCEKCHFPEKFSDDSLRQKVHYNNDLDNSQTSTYLVLKTGGGSKRIGLGKGIHWHIENPVYYYAADPEEQEIPYVRVMNDDGSMTEYQDVDADFNPDSILPEDLKEMDCITCHNRITHLVKQPEDILDQLLSLGLISNEIPEIRRVSVEMMRRDYDTLEAGLLGITRIEDYYRANYPDYYADHQDEIKQAVDAVSEAYQSSVFPEQKSDWDSHPNNIGHIYSPGCFRCHDGKHLNAEQEAVRLECNLCHSIPVVAAQSDFIADIEISRGPEPQTHLNPNWISMHHDVYDESCESCHTTADPGGVSNTSFCSNSACHGNVFTYAGFDAPRMREILAEQIAAAMPTPAPTQAAPAGEEPALTYDSQIGALFTSKCGMCHGENGQKGLNLTTYETALAGGDDGAVITPGDASNSLLIDIQSRPQAHFGQLSSDELQLVIDWIETGAPEN